MSEFNIGLLLPSTSAITRPFGQTEIQRPLVSAEIPNIDGCPSPVPSHDRKRGYDWSVHQDAPKRPNVISRPMGFLWGV